MTSQEIQKALNVIASTASSTHKQALIREYAGDTFNRVLRYAYDPFMRFGIASVEDIPPSSTGGFTTATWGILDALADRHITGGAAREELFRALGFLNHESQTLLINILKKDLRAGFTATTINKVIPGLAPTFDCMLAYKYDPAKIKSWPQVVETKLDGVRTLAFVSPLKGTVFFYSRSGKEFTTLEHLKEPILAMVMRVSDDEIVLDGEVVSGDFTKTVSEVKRKSEQATDMEFHIFDLLPVATFKKEDRAGCTEAGMYVARRHNLEQMIKDAESPLINITERFIVHSQEELMSTYDAVRAKGLEGLIVKDLHGLYHRRRNHGWMKLKNESTVDVPVIGVEEGTGKYQGTLGAFVVDYEGVSVSVGSGLSDAQRAEFWSDPSQIIGRLIEVEYHEITPDGSLRHPRFVRFRGDKPIEDGVGC